MTVSSTTNRVSYACGGGVTDFAYTFKVFSEADLVVAVKDASGTETILTLTTDYSVSGVGSTGGGNVTTVATYAAGNTLVILRQLEILQETDYIEGSAFPANSHEDALDKLTMIAQQLDEEMGRSLTMPVTSTGGGGVLSAPEALKYLRWNATETAIENAELVILGDLTAHDNSATPHLTGGWYATNSATGPVILASAAQTAAGNEASKVISPAALAAVWQYDELYVPAGAMISQTTNGATLSTKQYPTYAATPDYAEFGRNTAEEFVQFTLALPRTWDQATLKLKPIWMANYDMALVAGTEVKWGFQCKPSADGYEFDLDFTAAVYVDDTVLNAATGTRHVGGASANIASAIAGTDNLLDIRVSRKNGGANNALRPVWLTGVLVQFKKLSQVAGW
jgi:hypothetical protein